MLDVPAEHLAVIKSLLFTFVPDFEVRAFGSRITGTAKGYSDLDLVVIGKSKVASRKMTQLKEAFEESKIPFRIDVLDWQRISDHFKKIIEQQNIVIQQPR